MDVSPIRNLCYFYSTTILFIVHVIGQLAWTVCVKKCSSSLPVHNVYFTNHTTTGRQLHLKCGTRLTGFLWTRFTFRSWATSGWGASVEFWAENNGFYFNLIYIWWNVLTPQRTLPCGVEILLMQKHRLEPFPCSTAAVEWPVVLAFLCSKYLHVNVEC